jgi:hypothetical protein
VATVSCRADALFESFKEGGTNLSYTGLGRIVAFGLVSFQQRQGRAGQGRAGGEEHSTAGVISGSVGSGISRAHGYRSSL